MKFINLSAICSRFITFVFWQVTQGRKLLILLLRQQIVNVSVILTLQITKSVVVGILLSNTYTCHLNITRRFLRFLPIYRSAVTLLPLSSPGRKRQDLPA